MKIVVTGGAGFIGSNFIFYMRNKYPDYRIICIDKLTYAGNLHTLKGILNSENFRFVKADICDRKAVNRSKTVIYRFKSYWVNNRAKLKIKRTHSSIG